MTYLSMTTLNFQAINGFNFDAYYCSTTTDSDRSKMRNDFILKTFIEKYPSIKFDDNKKILKLLSVDKSARLLYKTLNEEFASLTKLHPVYHLEGLTQQERDLVISEYKQAVDAAALCGDRLSKIADDARRLNEKAISERDKVFKNVSPLTIVSLVTIENVPIDKKIEYIHETDSVKAKQLSKKIVVDYKRFLVKAIKANNGKFPDGVDPLA